MKNYEFDKKDIIEITIRDNIEIFNTKLEIAKVENSVEEFANQIIGGESLLRKMIIERKIKLANSLLQLGASNFVCNTNGNEIHILLDRISKDNIEASKQLLKNLLECGVNLEEKNSHGNTAFTSACSWAVRGKWYPEKKEIINICLSFKPEIKRERWAEKSLEAVLIEIIGYKQEEINEFYK